MGGALTKVVAQGDVLDGKTISSLDVEKQGRDGYRIAFGALFDDDSRAIYIAEVARPLTEVPSASTVGYLVLALLLVVAARSRLAV